MILHDDLFTFRIPFQSVNLRVVARLCACVSRAREFVCEFNYRGSVNTRQADRLEMETYTGTASATLVNQVSPRFPSTFSDSL